MKITKEVTRIPFPKIILKGDWGGITYAITSDAASVEEHNKIVAATERELIDFWLSRDWDSVYTFPDFMKRCQALGTVITKEKERREKE